jgi:hypothetical protein
MVGRQLAPELPTFPPSIAPQPPFSPKRALITSASFWKCCHTSVNDNHTHTFRLRELPLAHGATPLAPGALLCERVDGPCSAARAGAGRSGLGVMPLGAKRGGRDDTQPGRDTPPQLMACDAPLSSSPGSDAFGQPWGRPKARRTGPAVPASVRHAAAGSPPLPPCTRHAAAAAAAHQLQELEQLQQQQPHGTLLHQQWQDAGSFGPAPASADAQPKGDHMARGAPQLPPPGSLGAAPPQPPPQLQPRKAVRFAPGPLGALGRPAGSDGHPLAEGRVAAPVRPAGPPPGPSDPVTRSNISLLEELLGVENAPSLGRLKRRVGLLPPGRPPRVHLTTAPAAQRQVA